MPIRPQHIIKFSFSEINSSNSVLVSISFKPVLKNPITLKFKMVTFSLFDCSLNKSLIKLKGLINLQDETNLN